MHTTLTFGEYMRRLRRNKGMSLHMVADATQLSYTNLSRLENDSTMPRADTVAKLAAALDGDLKLMLELADCLPKAILDRIEARQESAPVSLLRSTGLPPENSSRRDSLTALVRTLSQDRNIGAAEGQAIADVVEQLIHLDPKRRGALVNLIMTLSLEDPADGR